jgi:hypothetical protein
VSIVVGDDEVELRDPDTCAPLWRQQRSRGK